MAARLSPKHDAHTRLKIQTSQLVNRLQDHVLSDAEMSKTQISAALGLLKKVLPDLAVTQVTGDAENPVITSLTVTLRRPEPT